jgi:hypothetical protein
LKPLAFNDELTEAFELGCFRSARHAGSANDAARRRRRRHLDVDDASPIGSLRRFR